MTKDTLSFAEQAAEGWAIHRLPEKTSKLEKQALARIITQHYLAWSDPGIRDEVLASDMRKQP